MSTKLHDIANNAILGVGVTPRTATVTFNGTAGDFISGDGQCCAIQSVGTIGGTSPSLAGKIQESSDQNTWTDISAGAFSAVAAADNLQAICFDRSKRYLRYVGTIAGTSPTIPLAVIITEQKKQV